MKVIPIVFGGFSANCYLIEADSSFVLVDTGRSARRRKLVSSLQDAGCTQANLNLVILTHGDFDHTGNAAFIRAAYGVKIAMHCGDASMVEQGDMFSGRKSGSPLMRKLANRL